jgi:[ribosomal protein S5]-alanine N-acetyltransferase
MEKLIIKTDRLTIRNLRHEDLAEFHIYRSNPEVTKFQGFDIMTMEEAKDFIQNHAEKSFGKPGEWVQYAIENNETKNLIGDCAIKINLVENESAEIGITISPFYQKKGYAKETLFGILKWLFEVKEFHNVVEIVDAGNTASINLLKSAGFRQNGDEKKNVIFKGSLTNELDYVMTIDDWVKINA